MAAEVSKTVQQRPPFETLRTVYFRGVRCAMNACAAALGLDAEEAVVSFGRLGDEIPNYQVKCGILSFVFWGGTHLPYSAPAKNLIDYIPNHFRQGTFAAGNMLLGAWTFSNIANYAAEDTLEEDANEFEKDLEAKYKSIIPPVPADDPDPANAERRMRISWTAQRDKAFRSRLLIKQGEPNHCAVCDMSIKDGLQGAHVVDVRYGGQDIVSNGLILCATHHLLFDAQLFGIEPKTYVVKQRPGGPTLVAMQIIRTAICDPVSEKALNLRWLKFQTHD